jgi:hypothetical protein
LSTIKCFFDKYLFIPFSINYAQDGKRDYLVYDIFQSKLRKLVGVFSWINAFEDDKCKYLYIPNKGVFLAERFNSCYLSMGSPHCYPHLRFQAITKYPNPKTFLSYF